MYCMDVSKCSIYFLFDDIILTKPLFIVITRLLQKKPLETFLFPFPSSYLLKVSIVIFLPSFPLNSQLSPGVRDNCTIVLRIYMLPFPRVLFWEPVQKPSKTHHTVESHFKLISLHYINHQIEWLF